MSEPGPVSNEFLRQVTAIVEANISDEKFGVTELAAAMNMSRSNLLRKVKKESSDSVNQLIRDVRLKRGMELLKGSTFNVTEVSREVGFSSTSYFIKCFREYYGYPPGEVGKGAASDIGPIITEPLIREHKTSREKFWLGGSVALVVAVAVGAYLFNSQDHLSKSRTEKSIVVLPFKNESNDSTNVYLINGLMESTLNNLQKIEDLKVLSRTSAELYRNTRQSIPQMAKELNANYFVEGSGQKIGDQILLNIQLIDGLRDKHLWAKQYRREAKDIFELQEEIAKNIAQEIKAIITPEEAQRIDKKPTDDLLAYDFYLKGRHLMYEGTHESMESALGYFNAAIAQDKNFALAYAHATITYYYLDIYQVNKKYAAEVDRYANNAYLHDPSLSESLIAKALSFMYKKEYKLAIPYLNKAGEYSPNSALVIHFLSEIYNFYVPNTEKYLENSLKGVRLNIESTDSLTISHHYMHLSNALLQGGFLDEALIYVNKSLSYNPGQPFAGWVKIGILYVKDKNLALANERLLEELAKDTSRFYIVQEIGKVHYTMRDYKGAYVYYKRFLESMERQQLDMFKSENLKFAMVFSKMGMKEKSEAFLKRFKEFADKDETAYRDINFAGYYAYVGDQKKAIAYLKAFAKADNFQYLILMLADDPVFDSVRDLPEFKEAVVEITQRFWQNHKRVKANLEAKGLLLSK